MDYPVSRQRIENILVGLQRDIIILSIKKYTLSDNALHLIKTIEKHLPEMVDQIRVIYEEGPMNLEHAEAFYSYLGEILVEALGEARLPEVIENDETDMVEHVKNQFIQVYREIKMEIEKISG